MHRWTPLLYNCMLKTIDHTDVFERSIKPNYLLTTVSVQKWDFKKKRCTPVVQVSLEREKMERAAVERQLADRAKELADLQARFDALTAEANARSAAHFAPRK